MTLALSHGYYATKSDRGGEDIVYCNGEKLRLVCNTKPLVSHGWGTLEKDDIEIWDEEANQMLIVTFFHCGIVQRIDLKN